MHPPQHDSNALRGLVLMHKARTTCEHGRNTACNALLLAAHTLHTRTFKLAMRHPGLLCVVTMLQLIQAATRS